ncbi:MAG: M20/M25/M40 family metallo-hydrolase [Nocardioidaceae bacterium]
MTRGPGPDVPELCRRLESQLPGMLATIEHLVGIDSGSLDVAGVNAVLEVVETELAQTPFAAVRHPVEGHGDCLELSQDLGDGPRVVVLGHADTVWPKGTADEWPLSRDGDWIAGPGVGDMKAALVMASAALRVVAAESTLGWGRISFVITPDELRGSAAARGLLERFAADADVCLTLEGVQSGGGMVVARGAVGAVMLRLRGRTAHCTEPGGASVISELVDLLPRVELLSRPDLGNLLSIGVIRAGTARQVVPDQAEVEIDMRGATVEIAESLLKDLHALASGPRRVPGVEVELTGGVTRPAFGADRSELLYRLAVEAAGEIGLPSRGVHERGGSDGSFFGALGVLTLDGLGPYCEDSCSRRERVSVPSIVERGAVLAALLLRIPEALGTVRSRQQTESGGERTHG